jgi:small-conductance mechanosensitive channel
MKRTLKYPAHYRRGRQMSNSIRVFIAVVLLAVAILSIATGLARNTTALAALADLTLFVVAVVLYLAPTARALHRNC